MNHDNRLKEHLDRSCEQLNPEVQQQLSARVSLAKQQATRHRFKLAYTLAPVAMLLTVWLGVFNDPGLTEEEQALYDDLELLIAEDELDFLAEMDISVWLIEQESSDGS